MYCSKYSQRLVAVTIKSRLVTIHPNPGPTRDKTEEGVAQRREGRKQKRANFREVNRVAKILRLQRSED